MASLSARGADESRGAPPAGLSRADREAAGRAAFASGFSRRLAGSGSMRRYRPVHDGV
jgi:hypothetical protein